MKQRTARMLRFLNTSKRGTRVQLWPSLMFRERLQLQRLAKDRRLGSAYARLAVETASDPITILWLPFEVACRS